MSGIPSSRRPATLASLAAELGVSRTTVSNAYNRPDQLSAPLRARVLEAARRLGYPGPDPVARSLRTRKAGAVGLLLTEALVLRVPRPGGHRLPGGPRAGLRGGRAGAAARAGEPRAGGRHRRAPGGRRRLRRLLRARGRPALPRRAGAAAAHRRLRPAARGGGRRPGGRRRPRRACSRSPGTSPGWATAGSACCACGWAPGTTTGPPTWSGRRTPPTRCSATASRVCATGSARSASTGPRCR